jgi:hypothetical protein
MNITYLHEVSTGVIAADGTAAVTLKPSVGQYWMPKFVRVSTNKANPLSVSSSYCAVYHGPVGYAVPSTFIDDTFSTDGDTSGIISGTVVSPGEGVTAKWTNGAPNDTVVLDLYGDTSDTPPGAGFTFPETLGPHFFGKRASPFPWQVPNNIAPFSFANPGAGLTATIFTANALPPNIPKAVMYMHAMEWQWESVNGAAAGTFDVVGSAALVQDSAASTDSHYMDFHGLNTFVYGNIEYSQSGSAPAGSTRCRGVITFFLAGVASP